MRENECRKAVARSGRPAVAAQLDRCFRGLGSPRSVALVGLPGFLVSELLAATLDMVSKSDPGIMHLVQLRCRDLRKASLADVILGICRGIDPDFRGSAQSLTEALAILREMVLAKTQGEGKLLLTLSGFHELADVEDTRGVQDLLDAWQAAITEDPQWLAIATSSYLPPARVCTELGWSPFYKVFGIRVFFAGLLEGEAATETIAAILQAESVSDPKETAKRIIRETDGVPALAAELVHHVTAGGLVEAASLGQVEELRERIRRFLPEDHAAFLRDKARISRGGERDLGIARECARLGLLRIGGSGQWTATLAAPTNPDQGDGALGQGVSRPPSGFVRAAAMLRDHEMELVKQAVRDTHYSSVEILQRREGEAIVLRLNRESERGQTQRPRVIKIAAIEKLRKEHQKTLDAHRILGPVCPSVIELLEVGAMGGLVLEFACADNRHYEVRTLEELCRPTDRRGPQTTAVETKTLSDALQRLLRNAMAALYRDPGVQHRRLTHLYPVPKTDEGRDLQELYEKHVVGAQLDDAGLGEVRLREGARRLLEAGQKEYREQRPILMCRTIHGDLNPRNCLIDGAENIHVIDFSSFGEGPLAKDFARLECEILFRLATWRDVRAYYSLLPILLGSDDLLMDARRAAALPLAEPLHTAVAAVLAIRMEFSTYAAAVAEPKQSAQDYAAALAATASRLALFPDYLSDVQLSAALVYAVLALERTQ